MKKRGFWSQVVAYFEKEMRENIRELDAIIMKWKRMIHLKIVAFSAVYDNVRRMNKNESCNLTVFQKALVEYETQYGHDFTLKPCGRILKYHAVWREIEMWVWDLNGDGVFRVKDVRNLLDETFLPKADTPMRWIKCIPIKVNVFVWKALQDRLPTRSNLVRRNILIDSLSCPICDGEPEDSSHLFFRCCLARDVTRLVCRWWDLDFHSFNSYTDWQGWFKQLRLGAKSKEVLEGVFYVSWWSLWNFRNHLLFADSNPRKDAIFDEIVLRSFNWCLARGNRTLNWVSWLQHPHLISM
ncbi:RNA-directed DNA polymerase, eukaryota [Tanacetum coccineum]